MNHTSEDLANILLEWSAVFMRRSMREFTAYARRTGLSMTQMNVLMRIYHRGPCEMSEIASLLLTSPAAASQLVERMIQQDLVYREESTTDRRVRLVHMTENARMQVEQSIYARSGWVKILMDSLPEDQRQPVADALRLLTEKAVLLETGADA